jgi:Holliday junction resolvasome RuvABC endonuclease subunit
MFLNILGVDPGLGNTGLCIMVIDEKLEITKIETVNLDLNRLCGSNNIKKSEYLNKYMDYVLYNFNIHRVSCESAFLNMSRPAAVIPVATAIYIIESKTKDFNIPFTAIPPSTMKVNVGAKGNSKKDEIEYAVNKIKEITTHINVLEITEHELDSIGMAYSLLLDFRR